MLRYFLFIIFTVFCCASFAGARTLLILGDSLSAAHGMPLEQGWVSQLQARLVQQGYNYKLINASISGETTRGARSRLPAVLAENKIDVAIVELGGNDGLRGTALAEIENNLNDIIEQLRAKESRVLLVKMLLPPNYGKAYTEQFTEIYRRLSRRDAVFLTAFSLEELVQQPGMMQDDGIHPTAAAQRRMLNSVWDDLRPLLERGE
ncbi:MAG: arylesterase [Gammaproteobacteria bacterium]